MRSNRRPLRSHTRCCCLDGPSGAESPRRPYLDCAPIFLVATAVLTRNHRVRFLRLSARPGDRVDGFRADGATFSGLLCCFPQRTSPVLYSTSSIYNGNFRSKAPERNTMSDDDLIYESDQASAEPDPDEVPIRDRRLFTQPYDLVVEALMDQIKGGTIFLRPLSERPSFQRRYVWTNVLASRLIESILLNVPIPPCYLSQNEEFELDVIDGQQRLFSLHRFINNQFPLSGLEVLPELNKRRFHEVPAKFQRQLKTHTLRCILITNESHPEIKFDVFERLNTNTVPLNAQELRNCIYRGSLNSLLQEVVTYPPWLSILGKKQPDKRMRDEELALRFFSFSIRGLDSYRTPQKHWLNDTAKDGVKYSPVKLKELKAQWETAIDAALKWFDPKECFRRLPLKRPGKVNRALFDLVMFSAARVGPERAHSVRSKFRKEYATLLKTEEFNDLISRAVDHTKRTKRRFHMWSAAVEHVL